MYDKRDIDWNVEKVFTRKWTNVMSSNSFYIEEKPYIWCQRGEVAFKDDKGEHYLNLEKVSYENIGVKKENCCLEEYPLISDDSFDFFTSKVYYNIPPFLGFKVNHVHVFQITDFPEPQYCVPRVRYAGCINFNRDNNWNADTFDFGVDEFSAVYEFFCKAYNIKYCHGNEAFIHHDCKDIINGYEFYYPIYEGTYHTNKLRIQFTFKELLSMDVSKFDNKFDISYFKYFCEDSNIVNKYLNTDVWKRKLTDLEIMECCTNFIKNYNIKSYGK